MFSAGTLVGNRFRVVRSVGEGAMGVVYQVYDEKLHRELALKRLRSDLNEPSVRERFLREARALAALNHPNILGIFDYFEDGDSLNLVMPLVNGRDLETLLNSGPPPLADLRRILMAVAEALDFAHAKGIVHRDVKPANILIEENGAVLLTDFGIAKSGERDAGQTMPGTLLGTPRYMAPEMISGQAYDYRVDIYALGVVTFEAIAGRPPFEGTSALNVIAATLTELPPRLRDLWPETPAETDEAVAKVLAKDPSQRFSSALDFVRAAFPESLALPERKAPPVTAERGVLRVQDSGEFTAIFSGVSATMLRHDAAPGTAGTDATGKTQILPPPSSLPPNERTARRGAAFRPRVSLTFSSAPDVGLIGRSVPITDTPFVIGRGQGAGLVISSDLTLSRAHCAIDWHDGAYVVRDLGSTNGLWVDGRAVKEGMPQMLLSGSVLRVSSKTTLTFVFSDTAELPDLSGSLIDGRYRLISQIRSSSKAAHYKGEDLRLPRSVAVKILSPGLAEYPGYLEELNREAEMAARLHHPHIAGVLDYGITRLEANGETWELHYVLMEFLEGGSLGRRIGESKLQTPAQVSEWLSPVASALDYAHRNHVIHSGMKPTSIVFDEEGKPYVTDFANATHSEKNERRVVLGAPDFLAPEQWEGLQPTQATDQYSLAALVYLALCGAPPFDEQQNPGRRARNFARGPLPVHEEVRRLAGVEIGESVSRVVAKGLAVNPAERYPSVEEFSLAFRQAHSESNQQRRAKPDVFFSYRRDTGAAWASLFSRELERQGIAVFVDTQRRDNVVRFPAWLEAAIEKSDIFICLLSATTLESNWVQHEIRTAFNLGKPMIPILQEDFKFPEGAGSLEPHIDALLTHQGVPLLDRKGIYLDAAIADVAKMVHASAARQKPAEG